MSKTASGKPELLAPVGDAEALFGALRYGADAVYIGGISFGMRAAASFSDDALTNAVADAHRHNVRLYVTCNTLPRNVDIVPLTGFLEFLNSSGADGVIVADIGVLALAKRYAPKLAVHISTQAGIVNYAAATEFYNLGASRVVLARELKLTEISEIAAKTPRELELECFVHGSMCVSFSGRCLISEYLTGRDANRGSCTQPCRWKYHLIEEKRGGELFDITEDTDGTYLYNSRDLCMVEHIPKLVSAGVSCLKIEGRAKTAYYTSVVTNAYRKAIDFYASEGTQKPLPAWILGELNKVTHREYSTGFYFGSTPGQATDFDGAIADYKVVGTAEGNAVELENDNYQVQVKQRNKFSVGDTLDVLPPDGISFEVAALGIINSKNEAVDSAPHPLELVCVETDKPVPAESYLRKKTHKQRGYSQND